MRITNRMMVASIYFVLVFHPALSEVSANIPVHTKWIKPKDSFSQLHHTSWEPSGIASLCQFLFHLGWSSALFLCHLALTKKRFHPLKNCHITSETPATWKFCCGGRESFAECYFKECPRKISISKNNILWSEPTDHLQNFMENLCGMFLLFFFFKSR